MHGLAASEMLLKQTLDAYKSVNCYSSSDENDEDYENPSDVEIIRSMVTAPQTAPIIQSRILCVLHNIPARMFRTFEIKTFGIEPLATLPHFEPNEDEDQEEYVPEIYKMRMASLLDDLLEDHPELVPPLADICYFAEISHLEGLMSVGEYIDRNDKPDQLSYPTGELMPSL
ncbi:unnamed protein product [Taenia asiatica]|uniref:Cytochrome P450 n=1 Tax=Taenia asiatica TaxID=60517 RepID=A0A0R3W0Z9_TAEAS|nr:unnamed protein product [Taenia asiatica]